MKIICFYVIFMSLSCRFRIEPWLCKQNSLSFVVSPNQGFEGGVSFSCRRKMWKKCFFISPSTWPKSSCLDICPTMAAETETVAATQTLDLPETQGEPEIAAVVPETQGEPEIGADAKQAMPAAVPPLPPHEPAGRPACLRCK